jgi:hypothetical protein
MSKDKKKIWVNIRYEFTGDVKIYECIEEMIEDGDLTGVLGVCEGECENEGAYAPIVSFGQVF